MLFKNYRKITLLRLNMKSFSNRTLNVLNVAKFILIIEIIFLIIGLLYIANKPKIYESKLIYSVGTLNIDFMQINSSNYLVDIPAFMLNFRQNPEVLNSTCPTIERSNLSFIQSKIKPNIIELSVKARDANTTQICILAIKELISNEESKVIKIFLDDNDYMIEELKASQDNMMNTLKKPGFIQSLNNSISIMGYNELDRQIAQHKIYRFKAERWGGRVIFQSPLPSQPIENNNILTLAIFLLSGLIAASFFRFIKTKL